MEKELYINGKYIDRISDSLEAIEKAHGKIVKVLTIEGFKLYGTYQKVYCQTVETKVPDGIHSGWNIRTTNAGKYFWKLERAEKTGPKIARFPSIYGCFEDEKLALAKGYDCNQFNGKYNFHGFEEVGAGLQWLRNAREGK